MTAAVHPLRAALWPLGLCYRAVGALRNSAFDHGLMPVARAAVPVLSVGNLTVGGTGKTPTVQWLCERLRARGGRPAVLARGYGRAPGVALNDEGTMLQRRLPWLLQEQDSDRVAGAARLVQQGATEIVLDDGFQHRRLARDLDLVCLDATMPFSNGQCLPSGDLRESPAGLRRADLVLLTRAGTLDARQVEARMRRIRELAGKDAMPIYLCDHAPRSLVSRPDDRELPLQALAARDVVLLTAVARPDSVRATVEGLGARVVADLRHRDHHRFSSAELAAAAAAARANGAVIVTTEKDDARIDDSKIARLVLRVELRFLDGQPSDAELRLP